MVQPYVNVDQNQPGLNVSARATVIVACAVPASDAAAPTASAMQLTRFMSCLPCPARGSPRWADRVSGDRQEPETTKRRQSVHRVLWMLTRARECDSASKTVKRAWTKSRATTP